MVLIRPSGAGETSETLPSAHMLHNTQESIIPSEIYEKESPQLIYP